MDPTHRPEGATSSTAAAGTETGATLQATQRTPAGPSEAQPAAQLATKGSAQQLATEGSAQQPTRRSSLQAAVHDPAEATLRKQRQVRFAESTQAAPAREPSGAIAAFLAEGNGAEGPAFLMVTERGLSKPVTETREGSESYFDCAARGACEEASDELGRAMRARDEQSEFMRFNGTPTFLTVMPHEARDIAFEPAQLPPETTGMAWFDLEQLAALTGPAGMADVRGAWHEVTRLGTSLAKRVIEAVHRVTKPPQAPPARTDTPRPKQARVKAPSGTASRAGLALLSIAAATDAAGNLPMRGEPPTFPNEMCLPAAASAATVFLDSIY